MHQNKVSFVEKAVDAKAATERTRNTADRRLSAAAGEQSSAEIQVNAVWAAGVFGRAVTFNGNLDGLQFKWLFFASRQAKQTGDNQRRPITGTRNLIVVCQFPPGKNDLKR
jgi:hypothetical protein